MEISAKKSFGQNFLKDETILEFIANSIFTKENDLIIEIGPGKGALTKYLVQKKGSYLGYEIDTRMISILKKYTNEIIYEDFLKHNIKEDIANKNFDNYYVIANIPYYITTPIIEHIINSGVSVNKMILMVQNEVADRFVAKPKTKEYGYFTVYLNYYFQVSKLKKISRNAFQPIPNVDSALVLFEKKELVSMDEKKYFQFLKQAFSKKRKTLHNNLKSYDWNTIKRILEKYHLSDSVRAEEIDGFIFQEIFNALH